MGRVFANGLEDRDSILGRVTPKTFEIVLDTLFTLSNIRYVWRVSGAIQKKEQRPPLHLGVVAIEKGAFRSLSTTVANIYLHLPACC